MEKLATIQMIDVWIPTRDRRWLAMPRYTQPSQEVQTEGKTSEIKVARTLRFDPGTILAIDRGYIDYEWFRELTRAEVYFVTRMKEKAVFVAQEELQVPQNSNVVSDQIVCFPRLSAKSSGRIPWSGAPNVASAA
jgi:hypothetical protein